VEKYLLGSRNAAVALTLLAISMPALASDDNPIATDRPDFVESSNVVGKGRLQVETSVALDRSAGSGGRESVLSTPTLLRFGVSENVELRVETDGAMRQRTRTNGSTSSADFGYADLSVGMKWHAMDARAHLPSVGVLLHADLSTGSSTFREEGTRPTMRMVAKWELPDDMSVGLMPGIGYTRQDGGKTFGILGLVIGKAWNQQLRSFVEVSSPYLARSLHGGSEASLTLGAAYLLGKNLQIDTALSHGLNSRTADLSLTVGLSFKL